MVQLGLIITASVGVTSCFDEACTNAVAPTDVMMMDMNARHRIRIYPEVEMIPIRIFRANEHVRVQRNAAESPNVRI